MALEAFNAWADAQGKAIVELAAADIPGFVYEKRPTAAWRFMDLHEALYAVAVYAVIVAVGLMRRTKQTDKKSAVSVAQKFRDEPILILQSIYNVVQVRALYLLPPVGVFYFHH
jgi:hypothetical protein